jgi:hypothetical protein
MSASRKHKRWLERVLDFVQEKTGLTYMLPTEVSRHIKVELFFATDPTKRCVWVVGSTPSDRRACQNAIQTLKRAIRERFGIVLAAPISAFSLEMVTTSVEDHLKALEQAREHLWQEIFLALERMAPDPAEDSDASDYQ